LGVVALSMVTYLIPNYGNSTLATNSPVLAEVDGKPITALFAQQQFQRIMGNTQIPPGMLDVYFPQFIESMIQQRAAVYQAERMGLTVSDDEVRNGFVVQNRQLYQNGTPDRKQLEQFYQAQGQTLEQGVEDVRNQLVLSKLQNSLLENVVVAPKEVEQEFARKYDKAKIDYILFAPEKFKDQVKPTQEQIETFFKNNRTSYMLPEKYSFEALVVDESKVEQTIAVTDAQLRQAYAQSMDNFRLPERVHARHILLKTEGKSDADKKALLTKAQDLVKQIKGGADFAEVAKKNSEDAAEKGGDLGWLVKGQTVPEFESAAFSLKTKDVSAPVLSQFGYHIIQVVEHEQARVKPFDEAREDLTKALRTQTLNEKLQTITSQAHAELLQNPKGFAEIAKRYSLDLVHVEDHEAGKAIPTLGQSPEIDNALTSLETGKLSEILVLPSQRVVMVILDNKIPKRNAELKEVEAQLRDVLVQQGMEKMAQDKAKEASERIKKGEDLKTVAAAFKLEVKSPPDFSINDSIEGLGTASYMADAFTKPIGTILGPTVVQGRTVIAKVTGKIPANMAALVAEHDTLLGEIKNRKARERNDLIMDSILNKLVDEGKVKVYRDEIQKLLAAFRNQNVR
jgi:peptidyl-prolyl cis-trans isomerase D